MIAPRIGVVKTAEGGTLVADASLETEPGFLFDALVLPDGQEAVDALAKDAHTMEFIRNQYRHCKAILVLGTSMDLISMADIPQASFNQEDDPGMIFSADGKDKKTIQSFIQAIARHRHFERETDPPAV